MIKYFIKNSHLNHVLLIFLLIAGVFIYRDIPKELFPSFALEKVSISGSYQGSSINNLDNIAVKDIEEELKSIKNIKEISSIIRPGTFDITVELNERADPIKSLSDIKDAVETIKDNLPSDMTEPTVKLADITFPLINVSISSKTLNYEELLRKSKNLKDNLINNVDYISDVNIYGEQDKEIEIIIDNDKIDLYNLNLSSVRTQLMGLSSIFPIANIEDKKFVFISTNNGKDNLNEWLNTKLKIDGKVLFLKDIADINIHIPQDSMLSSFNNNQSIILNLIKTSEGNTIEVVENIKKLLIEIDKKDNSIELSTYDDSSKHIKGRLDTVTSNLFFGLILIFIAMYVLVNRTTSIIVSMGIPIAFIIGLIFIYLAGHTINMVSLLGALIVIGLAVDDAVVVSENIQRYIDKGLTPKEAALKGAQELIMPITLSTLTTVATFLPLALISGELGKFLFLIPVAVTLILFGSLLESFFFLPLHAEHLMKKKSPSLDWTKLTDYYEKLLHNVIKWKKSTLLFFLIIVPSSTIFLLTQIPQQFFPRFDGNKLTISGKLDLNTKLEDTFKISSQIEKYLFENKEKYSTDKISNVTGLRMTSDMKMENGSNLFFITVELNDRRNEDIYSNYIEPIVNFSLDFERVEQTRHKSSIELANIMREDLKVFTKDFNFKEFEVSEDKAGIIKNDIEIKFSGELLNIEKSIHTIEDFLKNEKHILNHNNNINYGKEELKLKVNSYGEELGFNESILSNIISSLYLDTKISSSFGKEGVIDINLKSNNKDNFNSLMNLNIPYEDKFIRLKEIIEFKTVKNYEFLEKDNGIGFKQLNINLDKSKLTPNEFLDTKLNSLLDKISKDNNIQFEFGGEKKENARFARDMIKALIISFFTITVLLLIIFPNIKYVLMIISIIPLSLLGAIVGHLIIGIKLSILSYIGMLGLAGVVINGSIVMLEFLHGTTNKNDFYEKVKMRLRPVFITTITTFLGLLTLIFYATGQAVIMQPLAVSLGFGLLWGAVLTLVYLPALYALINKINETE